MADSDQNQQSTTYDSMSNDRFNQEVERELEEAKEVIDRNS